MNPKDLNDATTDVMQANVYYGPGPKQNDWSKSKTQFGLTKGGGVKDQAQSINAGIGILYQKGLKGGSGKKWTGGIDWSNAVLNYNGKKGHKEQYQKDVMNMSKSAEKK